MKLFVARHHFVVSNVGAVVGGFLSGIWWPANWLVGGTAGVIGALVAIGLAYEIETEFAKTRTIR